MEKYKPANQVAGTSVQPAAHDFCNEIPLQDVQKSEDDGNNTVRDI